MSIRRSKLLENADFRRLWLGQSLSLAGAQFGALAFPLVAILTLDASPGQIGLLVGIGTLPWLLFGLVVGVAIDRWPRRPVLIGADLGRGLLVGAVPIAAAFDALQMEHLFVAAFLVGTLSVFFDTAYQSYLPAVVEPEHLIGASSKLAMSESMTALPGRAWPGSSFRASAPLLPSVWTRFRFLRRRCV